MGDGGVDAFGVPFPCDLVEILGLDGRLLLESFVAKLFSDVTFDPGTTGLLVGAELLLGALGRGLVGVWMG